MSNSIRQLFSSIALAVLLGQTGCGGSFFSQTHSCTTCTVPTFLFATQANSLSGFTLSASGVPSLVGSVAGGYSDVVVDNSASFLFVFQGAGVGAFTINPTNGTLSVVAGSPFSVGQPGALAVDPSTRFLYATQSLGSAVAGFTIAAGTGVLTPIPGSPFPTNGGAEQAIVDPSGKFLYVSGDLGGGISAYTIDSSSGVLTPIAGFPFGALVPFSMATGGGGKFLYVDWSSFNGENGISTFTINSSNGALTEISGSPFLTPGGISNAQFGIASDPSGKFLYSLSPSDNTVFAFMIDSSSGMLTAVSGSPFATSAQPRGLVVEPAGQFLYVGENANSGIEAFSINATTGALIAVSGSPFSTGGAVTNLALGKP